MAHGVGEQVLDHLLEAVGIAHHLVRRVVDRRVRDDAARRELALVAPDDRREDALDGEQAPLERPAAAFEARQVEQVLHDALEPAGLALDGFEISLRA